jgi:hypothetical protein
MLHTVSEFRSRAYTSAVACEYLHSLFGTLCSYLSSIDRTLTLQYNNLTGDIPTALTRFESSSSFDYNCLSSCSVIRNPWCSQKPPTSPAQRAALVSLYNSTNGPAWSNNTNWLIGDPCVNSWTGVRCKFGRLGCWYSNITYDTHCVSQALLSIIRLVISAQTSESLLWST